MIVVVIVLSVVVVGLVGGIGATWAGKVKLAVKVGEAERAWEKAEEQRDEERNRADSAHALLDQLAKLASKPPLVVPAAPLPDLAAIAASLGEAIAKNLNPPAIVDQSANTAELRRIPGDMADLRMGMDDVVGGKAEGVGPHWLPATEFDEWLSGNPDKPYPSRGGWAIPRQPESALMKDVEVGPNGVERRDGQPMFRSGQGEQVPQGGVE